MSPSLLDFYRSTWRHSGAVSVFFAPSSPISFDGLVLLFYSDETARQLYLESDLPVFEV